MLKWEWPCQKLGPRRKVASIILAAAAGDDYGNPAADALSILAECQAAPLSPASGERGGSACGLPLNGAGTNVFPIHPRAWRCRANRRRRLGVSRCMPAMIHVKN